MTLIKSISGIRGTIGGSTADNLTPIDITKFAAAYATWLKEHSDCSRKLKVVIGRDARISGAMVSTIVEGTLLGCGVDVINIGLASTPTTEMAVTAHSADGGIIITASHNPKQWNALKLLNSRGEFLSDADGKRILEIAEKDSYIFPEVDSLGEVIDRSSYNQQHIDQVLSLPLVDQDAIKSHRFRIVVDAVNSVGGVIVPELLRQLGAEVIELNCEPNGEFAHNPAPIPANLTQISEAVVKHKADLGIVVDPDVDRLALVNEDGTMFGEEYTLVAVADYVLDHTPGDTVSNLSSSRALRDVTRSHNGNYSAAAVGEVNVVAKMKQTGAVIGGEGNGGVIYPELHYGRDALVGIGLILSSLAQKNIKISELRSYYPEYFISKNRIDLSPEIDVDKILEKIKGLYSNEEICDIDGVKIDFADGWVHLRKSNTEPIIRIYSEAATEVRAEELARQVMNNI
jgi:phosphomannomutase